MKQITVKAPAKVNFTLEIIGKRPDGYHNLKTIMHAISLYDVITVKVEDFPLLEINLSGNSPEIPYDEKNLVYKAAFAFLQKTSISNVKLDVFIEKNIPLEAGMGGGSSDAAGMLVALNKLFDNILSDKEIGEIAASLGSDINFCLKGGCALCTSRGEIINQIMPVNIPISIIKAINFGVSTKEAYKKYGELKDKSIPDATEKLAKLINKGEFDERLLFNSFEKAYLNDYEELYAIKNLVKGSMMTGSGAAFFVCRSTLSLAGENSNSFESALNKDKFIIIEGLKTVIDGVKIV